ncbi:hypothetical protein MHH81_06770 [Psychrobacillus sp. FSL H8-0484]|uniref:hypothetical protein n=1 Tax=Psychrobacillus sp. FSL H8-0484 TaxID=2921390 RepID=UPI0030F91A92
MNNLFFSVLEPSIELIKAHIYSLAKYIIIAMLVRAIGYYITPYTGLREIRVFVASAVHFMDWLLFY